MTYEYHQHTIRELTAMAGRASSKGGWHDRFHFLREVNDTQGFLDHIAAKLALVTSEVSEALEDLRTYQPEVDDLSVSERQLGTGKPVGFASELADVAIRVFDLAYMLDIDLDTEMTEKVAYNATRTHIHGKAL